MRFMTLSLPPSRPCPRTRLSLWLLLGVAQSLMAPMAIAQMAASTESTYHIEVLIFEGKGPLDEGVDGVLSTRAVPEVETAAAGDQAGRLLTLRTGSALQLAGVREQLGRKGYTVLAHAGWTQTASEWGTRAGLSLADLGLNLPGLDGAFLLERGSLLHFGMNLLYTNAKGQRFQLSELRRIKFNDRHYYDNPGIGVIAVVSPGVRPR